MGIRNDRHERCASSTRGSGPGVARRLARYPYQLSFVSPSSQLTPRNRPGGSPTCHVPDSVLPLDRPPLPVGIIRAVEAIRTSRAVWVVEAVGGVAATEAAVRIRHRVGIERIGTELASIV